MYTYPSSNKVGNMAPGKKIKFQLDLDSPLEFKKESCVQSSLCTFIEIVSRFKYQRSYVSSLIYFDVQ